MKAKYLFISLGMAILLTGCGKKVEYEGEHWYENAGREEVELELSKETTTDSLADNWEYGLILHENSDFAQDNTYYYIANPTDKNKLYRVKKDGSWEKEKILDQEVADINVLRGKVFFSNYNESEKMGVGIFSMDTNGSEPIMLTDMYPSEMSVVNDWVYFCDYNDTGIYKVHSETKKIQRLTDQNCGCLNVFENTIYALMETETTDKNDDSCWQLISMNVNGDDMKVSEFFKDCDSMLLANGMLFIGNSQGWWKVSVDNIDEGELICEDLKERYPGSVIGDDIYYFTEDNYLAKYNMATGDNKVYSSIKNVTGYDIFDGMIELFYTDGTELKVSVNKLDDGTPVAFYE